MQRRVPLGCEGTGWGCVVCHLPADGAVVVLCDRCTERHQVGLADLPGLQAVRGLMTGKQRCAFAELRHPFGHDPVYHPEMWTWSQQGSSACGVCGEPLERNAVQEQDNIPLQLSRRDGQEVLHMHWACAEACIAAGTLHLQEYMQGEDRHER